MKVSGLLFGVIVIFYLFLIVRQILFPFVDLPNHLAEAVIYQLAENPVLAHFYKIESGVNPNSFHYIFCSLFDSVEFGNKIYYALYVVLMPLSVLLVIHQLGGNWKFVFLSFLLIFNYNVTWGFAGYTLAIPFTIIAFYLACVDRWWSRIVLFFFLPLIYMTHVLPMLFSFLVISLLAISKYKDVKSFMVRISVIVPAFLLMLVWNNESSSFENSSFTFLVDYYQHHYFQEFYLRGKIFLYDNFHVLSGYAGPLVAALFSLTILWPLISKWVMNKGNVFLIMKDFFILHKENCVFLIASFFCCFFLPEKLPGQSILYQRFSVFLFIAFLFTGSLLYKQSGQSLYQWVALAVVVIHMALWSDYLSDFDHKNKIFNRALFSSVNPEVPMAGVILDNRYRGRPVYIHFPNYNIIWNHGATTTKMVDYRFSVVQRMAGKDVLPEYDEWVGGMLTGETGTTIPAEYLSNVKQFLIKGTADNLPENAKQIAGDSNWKIIKME